MKLLSNVSTILKLATMCVLLGFLLGFCVAGTTLPLIPSPGPAAPYGSSPSPTTAGG